MDDDEFHADDNFDVAAGGDGGNREVRSLRDEALSNTEGGDTSGASDKSKADFLMMGSVLDVLVFPLVSNVWHFGESMFQPSISNLGLT